jgi:hypothetical protein
VANHKPNKLTLEKNLEMKHPVVFYGKVYNGRTQQQSLNIIKSGIATTSFDRYKIIIRCYTNTGEIEIDGRIKPMLHLDGTSRCGLHGVKSITSACGFKL